MAAKAVLSDNRDAEQACCILVGCRSRIESRVGQAAELIAVSSQYTVPLTA